MVGIDTSSARSKMKEARLHIWPRLSETRRSGTNWLHYIMTCAQNSKTTDQRRCRWESRSPIELFATRSPCRCNRENEILRLEGKLLVVGGVKFDYNRWRDWSDIEVRLGLFYAGRVDN